MTAAYAGCLRRIHYTKWTDAAGPTWHSGLLAQIVMRGVVARVLRLNFYDWTLALVL